MGSSKKIISFVLAVYNVEDYLEDCIHSIVSEDGNYEVLLIDDGSLDSSGRICDEYDREYPRVKVYHKENGGLSDARNYGLHKAQGKYVFFVDSDDYLPRGSVGKLLSAAEKNVDAIVWDSSVVNENGQEVEYCHGKYRHPALCEPGIYTARDFLLKQLTQTDDFPRTVWLGMYKRSFLLSQNLWFEKGILHEDELWTPKVYLKAREICYLGEDLYCYRIRKNSIMNKSDRDYSKNLNSISYIYNTLPLFYDYAIEDPVLCNKLKADVSKRYLSAIAKYEAYQYPQIARTIRKREIWKNAVGIREKIRSAVLILNLRMYCILNNILKH